jgi:galactose oxidase
MNGNAVMFDAGQILSVGGAPNYENDRGTGNANVIDITSGNPTVRAVDDLNHPRTLAHSVVLPSGEVVVVGGQGISRLFTDDEATLVPELFDPDTGTWTELAPMATPRTYHSVALLLRDGRVLTGGGGLCGSCAYNHPDVEILTPPYLLDANGDPAPRPTITSAPGSAANGSSISVNVSGGASEFALVRMANSTHSVNNAQRRIPVDFAPTGGNGYSVQIPANAGVVPPGTYMLFALNAAGTPSIAAEIQVG